jgi:cell wall-associated NlpC family hydrolase
MGGRAAEKDLQEATVRKIALTPSTGGGVCIPGESLLLADIIVSTTAALVSRGIRAGTGSAVSHAMLYVGGGRVIEAIGQGVTERSLSAAISDATLAVAYRVKDINVATAAKVIAFARVHLGRKYDARGALGAGLAYNPVLCIASGIGACVAARAGKFNTADRFYCSELVLDAFKRAGAPIADVTPGTSVPQHIPQAYSSGRLLYVGHIVA